MKVALLCVGRVRGPLAAPIEEYEGRIRHYWSWESVQVREQPMRGGASEHDVRAAEGERLLERVPTGAEIVALHREGRLWSSERLSRYLQELALRSHPGAAFLIGGAFGLSDPVLGRATHTLSLGAFTLPHELARLVMAEQIYRAGTIARGEPYHKGARR